MKRKSIICLAVSALLVMSGCMMEEDIRVTGITFINPDSNTPFEQVYPTLYLRAGLDEGYLYASVTPSNAARPEVIWTTGNEFIAAVTPVERKDVPGTAVVFIARVNARGDGETTITATTIDGSKVATATVYVHAPTNAKLPTITEKFTQYATDEYEQGAPAEPLEVSATSLDGGILSYQWYGKKEPIINPSPGPGEPIPGATDSTYTPLTVELGLTRYRVIVTSFNSSLDGTQTATAQSEYIDILVTAADAKKPTISVQPIGATYTLGASPVPLTVVATSPDGGVLSYQWYYNSTESTTGGTPLPSSTESTYTPTLMQPGIVYYYAEVTNTNSAATENPTAKETTSVARIEIIPTEPLVHAKEPVIVAQPKSTTCVSGTPIVPLFVEATISDGGVPSYQWYSNSTNSTTGGTLIPGATNKSLDYPFPTSTIWYYVVVTNTNSAATGNKTASVTSEVATIDFVTGSAKPTIKTPPIGGKIYAQNNPAGLLPLTVEATSPDGGRLSFKWFRNTINSNTGGISVETTSSGATFSTCLPMIDTAGEFYYYVEITNTLGDAVPAMVPSTTAKITITPSNGTVNKDAELPKIEELDQDTTYQQGDDTQCLTVKATVTDGGDLSYEWRTTGSVIVGRSSDYFPPATTVGTTYYYVVVTNTNPDNGKTAKTQSNVYRVTVTYRDGVWKKVATSPFDGTIIRGVAAGGTDGTYQFIAVGVSGKMARFGTTWTAVADSKFGNNDINGIVSQGNRWVAVGNNGRMASSTNGETWTAVADSKFGNNTNIRSVASQTPSGGVLVAVGDEGKMVWSPGFNTTNNTLTWTLVADSQFGTSTIRGIAYGNDKWVAVGDDGKIAYSEDGQTSWTPVEVGSFSGKSINGVAYGDQKWLAVGQEGKMISSSDGIHWSEVPEVSVIFDSGAINSIAFGDNKWVAVGNNGKMAYSADGSTWSEITDSQFGDSPRSIYGVAFGYIQGANSPQQWVAVGQAGKMAQGDGKW